MTVTTSSGTLAFPYAGWKGDDVGSPQQTHFWYKVFKGTDLQNGICDVNGTNGYHRERLLFLKEGYSVLSTGYSYNNNTLYTPFSEQNKGYGNRNAAASVRCIRENSQKAMYSTGAGSENVIYVKEITQSGISLLSVNANLTEMQAMPVNVYDGVSKKSSELEVPQQTFRWSMQNFAQSTDVATMSTITLPSGGKASLMREVDLAGELKNGGTYMIFADAGGYNTYCLENVDGTLMLVKRTPSELTKDNIFKFEKTQESGANGSYNSCSYGRLMRVSDSAYLMANSKFTTSPENAVSLQIKNRWGTETGHDIDITNAGGQYLLYDVIGSDTYVGLSWGGSGARYKWYIYPVDPALIPD